MPDKFTKGQKVIVFRCTATGHPCFGTIIGRCKGEPYKQWGHWSIDIEDSRLPLPVSEDRIMDQDEYLKQEREKYEQKDYDVLEYIVQHKDAFKRGIKKHAKAFLELKSLYNDGMKNVFETHYKEFVVKLLRDEIIVLKNVSYEEVADIFTVENIEKTLGKDFFDMETD